MNQPTFNSSMPVLNTQLCTCTPKPVRESSFAACMDQCADGVAESPRTMELVPAFLMADARQARRMGTPLSRAWGWLHGKYMTCATKRLRVAETISLGEKRFVAIVSVEGQEFLIGGGSAGMSLLAQLGSDGAGSSARCGGGVR